MTTVRLIAALSALHLASACGGTAVAPLSADAGAEFPPDPEITAPQRIWHIDVDSLEPLLTTSMVDHGMAVRPTSSRINRLVKRLLVEAIVGRVNTAYRRDPDGRKRPGVSFAITFTSAPLPAPPMADGGTPDGGQEDASSGPGVTFSRICIGNRTGNCDSPLGVLGREFEDSDNSQVEANCEVDEIGVFAGRICGVLAAPLEIGDERFVDGSYKLGGGAASDARFKTIRKAIGEWGAAIGNVTAHEIGHGVGLVHDPLGDDTIMGVGDPGKPDLAFSKRSVDTLMKNLGTQK